MGQWLGPRAGRSLLLTTVLAGSIAAAGGGSVAQATTRTPQAAAPAGAHAFVVQARGGAQQAARAVRSAGGTAGRSLPIVGGVSARLSGAAQQRLSADPSVTRVAPDAALKFSSSTFSAATTASNYPKSTGATSAWDDGNLGAGVTVAIIDTGIAPVADLAGRIIAGPDFSGEGDSTADSYGHGTVIAGVIAGNGAASAGQTGGAYVGMAPQANVLSVKVAGRNGATDVSTVLAAMQWIGSNREQFNIKVVELAWGTPSDQSPAVDPLDFAVERLWHAGIVVVVAAGNDGPVGGTVTKPGDDPLVITVGADNDYQNTSTADDSVTQWSSRGPTAAGFAKPDLVAPGHLIVSTKSPGSSIDVDHPDAAVGTSYIRGSGTSQASAVVAGSVALMLSSRSWMHPDQVKYALTAAAVPINSPASVAEGKGRLWLPGSLGTRVRSAPVQSFAGTGLGSLEDSRGGRNVDTVCPGATDPTTIVGEIDVLCQPWDANSWSSGAWTPATWSSNSWSSNSWSSNSWSSNSWSSNSWSSFLTAFWGDRTPWWKPLPGENTSPPPVGVITRRVKP